MLCGQDCTEGAWPQGCIWTSVQRTKEEGARAGSRLGQCRWEVFIEMFSTLQHEEVLGEAEGPYPKAGDWGHLSWPPHMWVCLQEMSPESCMLLSSPLQAGVSPPLLLLRGAPAPCPSSGPSPAGTGLLHAASQVPAFPVSVVPAPLG